MKIKHGKGELHDKTLYLNNIFLAYNGKIQRKTSGIMNHYSASLIFSAWVFMEIGISCNKMLQYDIIRSVWCHFTVLRDYTIYVIQICLQCMIIAHCISTCCKVCESS